MKTKEIDKLCKDFLHNLHCDYLQEAWDTIKDTKDPAELYLHYIFIATHYLPYGFEKQLEINKGLMAISLIGHIYFVQLGKKTEFDKVLKDLCQGSAEFLRAAYDDYTEAFQKIVETEVQLAEAFAKAYELLPANSELKTEILANLSSISNKAKRGIESLMFNIK